MGMIDRELARLGRELRNAPQGRYGELYAAQQALSWAKDPQAFKAPCAQIKGIPANSEDYPVYHGPPQCGDIDYHADLPHDALPPCDSLA